MADKTKKGCPPAPVGARGCPVCKATLADFESGRRLALPCPSSPHSFESALLHQSAHVQAFRERGDLDLLPCTLVALGFTARPFVQVIATLQAVHSTSGVSHQYLEALVASHLFQTVLVSERATRYVEVSARRCAGLPTRPSPLDSRPIPSLQTDVIDYGVAGFLSPAGVELPEQAWGLVEVLAHG